MSRETSSADEELKLLRSSNNYLRCLSSLLIARMGGSASFSKDEFENIPIIGVMVDEDHGLVTARTYDENVEFLNHQQGIKWASKHELVASWSSDKNETIQKMLAMCVELLGGNVIVSGATKDHKKLLFTRATNADVGRLTFIDDCPKAKRWGNTDKKDHPWGKHYIKTRAADDEYREGWDRIWGRKDDATKQEPTTWTPPR